MRSVHRDTPRFGPFKAEALATLLVRGVWLACCLSRCALSEASMAVQVQTDRKRVQSSPVITERAMGVRQLNRR